MRSAITNIDWEYARKEEAKKRHDVMAHIAAFEAVCPLAKGIIHLGISSDYLKSFKNTL
jgi:adenylosuccinate lyase